MKTKKEKISKIKISKNNSKLNLEKKKDEKLEEKVKVEENKKSEQDEEIEAEEENFEEFLEVEDFRPSVLRRGSFEAPVRLEREAEEFFPDEDDDKKTKRDYGEKEKTEKKEYNDERKEDYSGLFSSAKESRFEFEDLGRETGERREIKIDSEFKSEDKDYVVKEQRFEHQEPANPFARKKTDYERRR